LAITVQAQNIEIPNGSFEGPATDFAFPLIDSWQEMPEPLGYDTNIFGAWYEKTGVFLIPAEGKPGYISNGDGAQALFLIAFPQVGMTQDYETMDYKDQEPSHAFDAQYEVGKAYRLSWGARGGGGGMNDGSGLEAGLYYLDDEANAVTIASTNILYDSGIPISDPSLLTIYRLDVPTVQSEDPWAGKQIGVRLISTVSLPMAGGYWDIDNVRLEAIADPVFSAPVYSNGVFTVTLQSTPGLVFEVLASTEATLPVENWTSLGTVTNVTGTVDVVDAEPDPERRYYQARTVE